MRFSAALRLITSIPPLAVLVTCGAGGAGWDTSPEGWGAPLGRIGGRKTSREGSGGAQERPQRRPPAHSIEDWSHGIL